MPATNYIMNIKKFYLLMAGFLIGYLTSQVSSNYDGGYYFKESLVSVEKERELTGLDTNFSSSKEDKLRVEVVTYENTRKSELVSGCSQENISEESDVAWEIAGNLKNSEAYLIEILDEFSDYPSLEAKEEILEIIDVLDPETQKKSIKYLTNSNNIGQKISGLEILARVGQGDKEMIEIPLEILKEEVSSEELISAAIKSIPLSHLVGKKNEDFITILEHHSKNDNIKVRAESLIALGSHATRSEHLKSIMSLPDADVAIIVSALHQSKIIDEDIKHKLLNYSFDENLSFENRYVAIKSLERFLLTESEQERVVEISQRINGY